MTGHSELATAVRRWLRETSGAVEAADWVLGKADISGRIPKQLTCSMDETRHFALVSFFSDRYVRSVRGGGKCKLLFERWEDEVVGESGVLLPLLARARGRTVFNRRQEKEDRAGRIADLLRQYTKFEGLSGFVAQRELDAICGRKGRFWCRSGKSTPAEADQEIRRYLDLLQHVERLKRDPVRIERVVHVSREVAGDTHWLRPGNQVWRDLAEDAVQFDPSINELIDERGETERAARVLSYIGLAENLTSVTVLAYGRFALTRNGAVWNWASEAANHNLPVWFSAQHLADSAFRAEDSVDRVISVENETSFLDLIEAYGNETETILVYTEGHANRAVISLLRLIAQACPRATFCHQGDLDLPGVRILASLTHRTGVPIQPSHMDADTHRQFEAQGIRLSDRERRDLLQAMSVADIPCRDLLQRIATTGKRIEQEVVTATGR